MRALHYIMIVDDDSESIYLTRLAFSKSKANVNIEEACDGADAMEKLRKFLKDGIGLPDIILLDLNMPRIDGIEFLQQVKQDKLFKHIPVIMMTISENEEDILKSYCTGAAGYVVKPVNFSDLCKKVNGIHQYWFDTTTLALKKMEAERSNEHSN